MRRSAVAVTLFGIVLFSSDPARAQSPASDDKKTEARGHFEKAVGLFEEEAWDAALAEFLRSRELYATRAATKNAALCLRKLHRFDESLEMFETLLREFPNLPPDDKALADKQIADLRTLVGSIEVTGAEAGASIVVDGRDRGSFPSTAPIRVPAGTHVLRVFKEGFAPFEGRVEVAGGQSSQVNAHLGALTQSGRLKVTEQTGKTLEVLVDGIVVGKTPWEGPLSIGDHTVVLRGEGSLGTQPASAPVKLNQVTPISLVAESLDAQIRVEPTPAGGSVAIDGVVLGRGIWEGRLRVGAHKLEVAAEGFLPQTRTARLDAGRRQVIAVQLERDPTSPLWRAANPPKILFELNGAFAMVPLFGGDLADGCTGSCSQDLSLGSMIQFHGGYQFGSNIGFAIDAAYLRATEHIKGRAASVPTHGFTPEQGTIDDALRMSGILIGVSGSYRTKTNVPLAFRLGAGVMLAQFTDVRSATLTTTNPSLPTTHYTVDAVERPSGTYFYVEPEVRVGFRLTKRAELSIGVAAILAKSLGDATWSDKHPLNSKGDGTITFGSQSIAGSTMLMIAPGLGLRYDF